jgi:Cu2+-exporting ATPase
MVQVVAARRLFEAGIMVKDGSALERLAEIDTVIFDKTGTLTQGIPQLTNANQISPADLVLAAALAMHSRHPHSQAIAQYASSNASMGELAELGEYPGYGIEAQNADGTYRLGRADWALGAAADPGGTVLSFNGKLLARFDFTDILRPGAVAATRALADAGLALEIISGDRPQTVATIADKLGIASHAASVLPGGKAARIAALASSGHKALMVGDGLNDAPALAAAHVSMAPASAADVGRNAADFVFLHNDLSAVPFAVSVAREAGRLVRQNFALSILYNVIALPIAIAGLVNPFLAAVAMSASSIVVVLNALRLGWSGGRRPHVRLAAPAAVRP